MTGELEVALRKDRTISDYREVLTSSKEETDRLINLVENLLFLAREDQGKQTIEFETVDMTDMIGSVIASLKTETNEKRITLHFKPDVESTFVSGQPSMLRRLCFNIVHNAILYTPPEGSVWISLSTNKQYAQVEVKDTGIGILQEDQKKIFSRFYRVDSSRSQTKGYGLGLAICKSIVKLHHGSLVVHSALGQGSTFTITLPMPKS
jgi:signal transduction histidine kinase